jgi:hypothetical protein
MLKNSEWQVVSGEWRNPQIIPGMDIGKMEKYRPF